jgi:hypothetical protein
LPDLDITFLTSPPVDTSPNPKGVSLMGGATVDSMGAQFRGAAGASDYVRIASFPYASGDSFTVSMWYALT